MYYIRITILLQATYESCRIFVTLIFYRKRHQPNQLL
jgi:hypothetical protein